MLLCLRRVQAWGCVAHAEYLAKQKQAEQETQEGIDSLDLEAAKPAGEDGVLLGQSLQSLWATASAFEFVTVGALSRVCD